MDKSEGKYVGNKKIYNLIVKYYKFILIFILYILSKNKNLNILVINYFFNFSSPFDGRIFLCTLYNNEAEMAYIHIWRLYYYVDKFIIVTNNITYSGNPKKISFKPFENDIKPYMNKVEIVYYNNICNKKEYPEKDLIWCNELSQRDYAKIFIEENFSPTEKDLLIIADIDEILTREGIKYIKKNPPKEYYFLKGNIYFPYYYHKLEDCDRTIVIRYHKNMKTLGKYRNMTITKSNTLKYFYDKKKPLITHCSYCFKDLEEYKNKLKSFSHQEYNKEPFITNDWIFKSHYCREKIGSPPDGFDEAYEGWKHLIPDDERLKYLIDRSFMYQLNLTNYTEKDLDTLCSKTFNRTPFELSAKYKS